MSYADVTFAGYRLEQLIASDSVSQTFRAIPQTRGRPVRPVALRISPPLEVAGAIDPQLGDTFLRVVRRAAAIVHPGLAIIRDAGHTAGRVYVATDVAAGTTLETFIAQRGPLPADDAVARLWPLAQALDRAHAAGVVHGAISPRTIRVVRGGGPTGAAPAVLTGFGLDTLLVHLGRVDRDRIDVTDLLYVAPEQLRGAQADERRSGPAVDGRADQYALGCALYHCVAGRPPFLRDTAAALFGAHLFREAVLPAGRDGGRGLSDALAVALAKDPGDRHASCVALLRATGHLPQPGRRPEPSAPRQAAPPRAPDPPPAAPAPPPAAAFDETAALDPAAVRRAAADDTMAPGAADETTVLGITGAADETVRLPRTGRPSGPAPDGTGPPPAGRMSRAAPPAGPQPAAPSEQHMPPAGPPPRPMAPPPGPVASAPPPGPVASAPYPAGRAPRGRSHRGRGRRAAGRGRARRPGPLQRLPIPWPAAALLVLAGIVATLLIAAWLRPAPLYPSTDPAGEGAQAPAGVMVDSATVARSGVPWQQRLADEPIRALAVGAELLVAGTDHTLFALQRHNGAQRWTSAVQPGSLDGMTVTADVAVIASQQLLGLSSDDGTRRWSSAGHLTPVGALTTVDDTIYGVHLGRLTVDLVATDAATGRGKWTVTLGVAAMDAETAVVADARHVLVLVDGTVMAVDPAVAAEDPAAAVRWRRRVADPWARSLTLVSGAAVVASRDGRVCAYAALTGQQLWCARIVGLDRDHPVVVAGDGHVVMVMRTHVTALAAGTGELAWVYDPPDRLLDVAVEHRGAVVVVDAGGTVHGITLARGHERWRASGFRSITALASAPEAVYAGTGAGRVVTLRPDAAPDAPPQPVQASEAAAADVG